jgi:hypothetical protein
LPYVSNPEEFVGFAPGLGTEWRKLEEAGLADFSWTNGVGGDWSNSGDWTPTGVPSDSSNTVTIGASGTYTVEINSSEGFGVDSITLNNAGTTLAVDGTLTLNSGFKIAAGKITGDGFLSVSGGMIGGGTISVANQSISGAVVLSAPLMDTGSVSIGSSGSDVLALGIRTLTLTGKNSTIAGTLRGKGMLALAGGTQALNDGASLQMAKFAMSGHDVVSLNTSLTYAGALTQGSDSALTIASGQALTLTSSAKLSGKVSGAVNLNGGSLLLDTAGSGSTLAVNGGALSVVRNIAYAGGFTDKGSTIALGGKTLTVTGSTLSGIRLMTAGTLSIKGTSTVAGVSVRAGGILSNAGSTTLKGQVVLGNATTAGQLVNNAGATLILTTGQAASAIVDPARRNADGIGADRPRPASILHNRGIVRLTKGGGRGGVRGTGDPTAHIAVAFDNAGTGTVNVQSGALEFDAAFSNADSKTGAISVAAGAVVDFNGGGTSAAGAFSVAAGGLLEFSGGTFTLTGEASESAISVTGGTLDIVGAVDSGKFNVTNGGTLEIDANQPGIQTLIFGAGGGTLVLNGAVTYHAATTGFGAKTALDLTGFKFSGKPKVHFVEDPNGKHGLLTVTDGSQTRKLTLFGQYVSAGFHLAADSGGGTIVTYKAPAPHLVLAAAH